MFHALHCVSPVQHISYTIQHLLDMKTQTETITNNFCRLFFTKRPKMKTSQLVNGRDYSDRQKLLIKLPVATCHLLFLGNVFLLTIII